MTDAKDDRSHDSLRVRYLESLIGESERRYGRERTKDLRNLIETTADNMASVALFPLGTEDRPAFLFTTTLAGQ